MALGKLLSPKDVCELTGYSMERVLRLIALGKLPATNQSAGLLAPRWVIRECDLEAMFIPKPVAKKMAAEKRRKRVRLDANIPRHFDYTD